MSALVRILLVSIALLGFALAPVSAQNGADQPAGDTAAAPDNDAAGVDAAPDVPWWEDPDRIAELVQTYGIPVVKALVLLLIGWIVAGWVRRMTKRASDRAKIDETLGRFFSQMARWAVLIFVFMAAVRFFGVETTSFAAVIAGASLAIGLAFQGTLGNLAAGVMLIIFRPFKVGDVVSVSGVTGKVTEVDLFTTIVDTPDNRRIIVPNGSVFGSTIENVTHHSTRRADVAVGVDYTADIDRTREVLTAAAMSVEGRLADQDPVIYLVDLGDSSVNWAVRIWCKTEDYWAVREASTRAVKQHLDEAGIGIPFPQMDVHLDKLDA